MIFRILFATTPLSTTLVGCAATSTGACDASAPAPGDSFDFTVQRLLR